MMPVVRVPSWGSPDDSSNIEPTAAIAATQEPPKKTPLFGVTLPIPNKRHTVGEDWVEVATPIPQPTCLCYWFYGIDRKAVLGQLLVEQQGIFYTINE